MKAFSEEEIRSNLIIPFLKDLGLSYNDLSLETTFSIQLGRGVYDIKNDEKHFIGGRLDILCKVDNKNLFIIELKAEDVPINKEKDSKQGLSYARLLQPMPPYVIVTNGKETYLFDTIYGKEVDKNYIIEKGYYVNIEEDILFRFNALKNFIGYSYENLIGFCKIVSNQQIEKFSAIDSDNIEAKLNKKYIKNIFVQRDGLIDDFRDFLKQSDKNIFAIVGESGCGKTNAIINLYEQNSDLPTLFYSGTLLGNSFFEEIKFDFNLEFSPQETDLTILKKISSLSELHDKKVLIFIDAIDEWVTEDRTKQLNNLIKIAIRYNIQICLSCKDLLWDSLLYQNGIPTNLSQNLFKTFILHNFTGTEFNRAIDNYSNFLDVPISSNQFSLDLRNPFSLRIAFEVSYLNNSILSYNQDSSETISIFINQKLIKTYDPNKCKRYLFRIADLLLKNDKIHEDENIVRQYLGLGINDEIPFELFLNNFLYRNNIDNKKFIGFYFSKIRDFVISNEILALNSTDSKQRIEVITKSLNSFIGENAINFYFKNCGQNEQFDCIAAFMLHDKQWSKTTTIRLLAQQDSFVFSTMATKSIGLIILYIENLIKVYSNEFNIGDEINIVLSKINESFDIEESLIGILILMNTYETHYRSYSICKELAKYNSELGTNRLIEILINRNFDDDIRRFVIDSLNNRELKNRKEIFLALLNEEIETQSGVYFYAINWYCLIEDTELRNKLLDLLDCKDVREYIVDTLAHSKLEDTGKLLYEKYLNNKYSDSVTWWLCRAICSLDYKPCIFRFVEIINEQPSSELTGHLLIGLGQMKALELKPTLFDLIKNLPETYNNGTWLVMAFTDIMNSDDYVELLKIANNSDNIHTMLFAAKALSSIKESIFYTFILNCLNNNQIEIDKRYQVFQEWGSNLTTSEKSMNGVKMIENIEFSNNVLSRDELSQIYLIFQKNTELSEIAFSVLINFETDVEILLKCLVEYLPLLKYPIKTNRFHLINIGNLQKLRLNLILWLRNQLLINHWTNKIFLFNCLQISGIVGDFSIVELLENNKVNILTNLPSKIEEEEIDKERYFNNIVHLIRVSPNKIRTRLNSF